MTAPSREAIDKARDRARKLAKFVDSARPARGDFRVGAWVVAAQAVKELTTFVEQLARTERES